MRGLILAIALLFTHEAAAQMKVGINLAAPTDYGRNWVWKDQLRQARWYADNSWWLVQWGHEYYPSGRWVAEWTGDDAPLFVRGFDKVDEVLPGLAVAEVRWPINGLAIEPFRDVRELRLWAPGVNRTGSAFHPEYVAPLRGFAVLRFMDWQATNLSAVVEWSQRRLPDVRQQWVPKDNQGVALEHCLDLANEVNADPWLCIPHQATDDFVRRMAELIRDRMAAEHVCYLEWGNELWNTAPGFEGGKWLRANATITGKRTVDLYGGRLKTIAAIVRPILGERVRLVLAGQANNVWVAEQEAIAAGRGNFDCISCAWYFGLPKGFVPSAEHSAGQVMDACQADIDGRLADVLAKHAELARKYSVPLVLYEGGQHLTAPAGGAIAAEVVQCQRHPRMADLYTLALAKCREAGATLALAYNDVGPWGPTGSWGLREHMTDFDSPKWRAIVEAR